jgi:hypothetical protein
LARSAKRHAHLRRGATKSCEKCGLKPQSRWISYLQGFLQNSMDYAAGIIIAYLGLLAGEVSELVSKYIV